MGLHQFTQAFKIMVSELHLIIYFLLLWALEYVFLFLFVVVVVAFFFFLNVANLMKTLNLLAARTAANLFSYPTSI